MKQIIVNADDFGINEVTTSEIERQILAKRVSSTSVMANGRCLEEVQRFAKQHPEISFGVHLCLSEFDSLTRGDALKKAGLVGDDGKFVRNAIFQEKNLKNIALREAIKEELNAQIDVVSSLGFPISHVDSHHHIHTIFLLKDLFSEVLSQRGIMKLRLGYDYHTLRMKLHIFRWMRQRRLNKFYRSKFLTTDGFYSFSEFLDARLPIRDGETIELMCHPGHPNIEFKNEIQLLERFIIPDDITLVSYNDLS